MRTAVDSNILFDLMAGEPAAADAAEQALFDASALGPVVLSPVTYAEVATGFPSPEDIVPLVSQMGLRVEPFSAEALHEATTAWKRYTAQRGAEMQCPRCGHLATLVCPSCKAPLTWRQHMIADFLIGGHALRQADRLLTRDTGYYRFYFPTLILIAP